MACLRASQIPMAATCTCTRPSLGSQLPTVVTAEPIPSKTGWRTVPCGVALVGQRGSIIVCGKNSTLLVVDQIAARVRRNRIVDA